MALAPVINGLDTTNASRASSLQSTVPFAMAKDKQGVTASGPAFR